MKNGKYIPLGDYNNVKIGYGTVDFKNLKTVYLKLNSWLSPDTKTEDFDSVIYTSRKKIKNIIYDLNNEFFKRESIVDIDVRTNSIKAKKKSFMNMEVTLYVDKAFEVRSKTTKAMIHEIIVNIIDNGLSDKTLFNFHKTKK